ncbi:hypothetical protein DR64_5588 [Paraburkholderia xenovorans LB400]|nr:hypothetical protein DR64_5588 [Paraburkholderia xenovorans LB400]
MSRDVAVPRARHELRAIRGLAHLDIAAHKRHDSATWAARTNAKSYTRSVAADAAVRRRFGLPSISPASPASACTAGASCPAGVLP